VRNSLVNLSIIFSVYIDKLLQVATLVGAMDISPQWFYHVKTISCIAQKVSQHGPKCPRHADGHIKLPRSALLIFCLSLT
jgi:hypothetical protein